MNKLTITNQTLDSREVAEMLEKAHWMLLRDIEGSKDGKTIGIIKVLTDNKLGVSDYFIESNYKDSTGRTNKCYLITKMGCEILGNKQQGEKGILFTAKYVKKFNEMEKRQVTGSYAISDPIKRAEAWIKEQQQKELLNSQLQEKNRFINQIAISENSLLVREVAKIATKENISIGEKRLWNKLREWNLVFKNSTEPMQDGINRGLFEVVEGTRTCKGKTFTYQTTRVTGKGQAYIINKLLKE